MMMSQLQSLLVYKMKSIWWSLLMLSGVLWRRSELVNILWCSLISISSFMALTQLVGWAERHPICKKTHFNNFYCQECNQVHLNSIHWNGACVLISIWVHFILFCMAYFLVCTCLQCFYTTLHVGWLTCRAPDWTVSTHSTLNSTQVYWNTVAGWLKEIQ